MPLPPRPVHSSLELIGNTPVVQLRHVVPDHCAQIFVKLESVNTTGSYKDRMAKSMVEEAERRGDLKPGMTVVEATGGSTVSSNAYAVEKLRTIEAFGANLDLVHSPSGKITADLVPSMICRAEAVVDGNNCCFTNQFKNRDALVGYETIGHELLHQFPERIDAFCGAWPKIHIAVLEPASSPTITEGHPGVHGVEGVGIGYIPPLLDRQFYDEALAISKGEGRNMCRRLAKEEGLLVGTPTGLNVLAAIKIGQQLGPGKIVVIVAADTGLKYLNGSLFADR
ncbi:hypothetical protein CNMCM7691_004827 [Aspergillus felis]|uniref:Tryptophan synthase beta chain-like PALP domain-containing protein n=1 Tax=Aspergillus felis TaxID=1287682 RepID=A0A8H6R5H2_9EURO|nr:hypothetical protein CNMCM7691_004827 [Aspergillus felis]